MLVVLLHHKWGLQLTYKPLIFGLSSKQNNIA